MGSEIDDVLINVGIEGFTHFKIEGVEFVNGRRKVTLTLTNGKEELYNTYEGKRDATMKYGDQFNLTLSESPTLRNSFYDKYS